MRSNLCVCGARGAYLVYVWEKSPGQEGNWTTWMCDKNVHLLYMSHVRDGVIVQLPRNDKYYEVVKVGCTRQPFGEGGADRQVDTVFLKEWKHDEPGI